MRKLLVVLAALSVLAFAAPAGALQPVHPYIEVLAYPVCTGASTVHGGRFEPAAAVVLVRTSQADPDATYNVTVDYSGQFYTPVEIPSAGNVTFTAYLAGVKSGQTRATAIVC